MPEPELASAPDGGLDAQPVPAPDRGLDELAVGGWKKRISHQMTCSRREFWAPMVERRGRSCGDAAMAQGRVHQMTRTRRELWAPMVERRGRIRVGLITRRRLELEPETKPGDEKKVS
jgi:hypothetical protein